MKITKEQRKILKAVIGNSYVKEVIKILTDNGTVNRLGKPYGASMVRNVFNGRNNNYVIQEAILEVYTKAKIKKEEQEKKFNNMLGTLSDEYK